MSDEELTKAVNAIIASEGGIFVRWTAKHRRTTASRGGWCMTNDDGYAVGVRHIPCIDAKAKALGSKLHAPFMTLSFMVLFSYP